jgi:uncharacterized repeat protein (TIGR02543 family)
MAWSWNELQEGQQLMPTVGDGYGYGRALAEAVGLPRPEPTRHSLLLTASPGGVVKGIPAATNCSGRCRTTVDDGWQVILTAIPRRGFMFRGWTRDCRGRNRSCSFIIEQDTSVRATFARSK